MESTAPPQTVPVDRLCLYRMPAAPAVLLPQTECGAAAQAEDDNDDNSMEYIPMKPQQKPQLLPHQQPPPGPPPVHHRRQADDHQGHLRRQDHNIRNDNRRPRLTIRDLRQEEHFSGLIRHHRAIATANKTPHAISRRNNRKGCGVHTTHMDQEQDQHMTGMQDHLTQEEDRDQHATNTFCRNKKNGKNKEDRRSFQRRKGKTIHKDTINHTTAFANNHAATRYSTPKTLETGPTTFDVPNRQRLQYKTDAKHTNCIIRSIGYKHRSWT
jgi:hypothetical protein